MVRILLHALLLAGIYVWSLAPVISFVQQTTGGASVLEICTPAGYAKVAVNGGTKEPGSVSLKCPFCTVVAYGGLALAAPDDSAWQKLDYPPQVFLRLTARDYAPTRSYTPGQSVPVRAPPVFS